ncbi:GDP-mannose-dependent alpha-mannosyltransferase [Hypericibacter adhaerens]|jgi:glycosyltransferase involved in cell wall biosynthesis|uniref:GDP-mannose-dependent alpha-mannosyltransferase n=1 Tax=Hypericibacter adhaerens TaxID=2602016 RepID=A0A5J6MT81_9PROT|nr:GDP-mannose-dependent alpha-mannosyltransferase [Hypericibacter adhaerens]
MIRRIADLHPPLARSLRILIATDAWRPQVNGVVRTLGRVTHELEAQGHQVEVVGPDRFRTLPCPTYPEIRLALLPGRRVARTIENFKPDCIHISTEGPIGRAARAWCLKHGHAFTTAYHTKFPEYVRARCAVPLAWSYAVVRRFHAPSTSVMVATDSIASELLAHGFTNIRRWSRGVDTELFRPRDDKDFLNLPRPIHLYVGRVAIEKNIEAFLELDLPGSKLVVGDGPQLPELKKRHPGAFFAGEKHGEELARHYAAADIFVFPSRTDTFGLVLLEALASGLPVAAYPVPGPLDVINGSGVGALHENLKSAIEAARDIDPGLCRAHALEFSWAASARQFLGNLAA